MKVNPLFLLVSLCLAAAACNDSNNDEPDDSTGDTGTGEGDTGDPPGAVYSVLVNGERQLVERVDQFQVPVNYVLVAFAGDDLDIEVTSKESSFSKYTLSPKSKGIEASQSGDTLSFTATEPGYFVLQIPEQERLFILIDPEEEDAPSPDGENVKNIMDYEGVDATGETVITEIIQEAIDEASGSDKNILYFPEGTYSSEILYLKDDMTLYLAKGAVLKNATPQNELLSHPAELTDIEGGSYGFIMMNGVENARLMGRGTIDGNGVELQSYKRKMFLLKIENSRDCVVDGVVSRDSAFWNTLIYRSDNISIRNYKVINNRLENDTGESWNETDGVDFDNCTGSTLYNAFLYTGDDCMAVKADDIPDSEDIAGIRDPTEDERYMNTDDISHEKVVCFSGSAACKVGTKTFGETMSNISFKDVDVVEALRAMVIDAVDTANITGTRFEDIRIEHVSGRLIDFNMDPASITWRVNVGTCTVTDTKIIDVASDINAENRIQGNIHDYNENDPYYGNEYYIDGVTFTNYSVEGNVITGLDDENASFNTNEYAVNIEFD
jgi:polygalacturonase